MSTFRVMHNYAVFGPTTTVTGDGCFAVTFGESKTNDVESKFVLVQPTPDKVTTEPPKIVVPKKQKKLRKKRQRTIKTHPRTRKMKASLIQREAKKKGKK